MKKLFSSLIVVSILMQCFLLPVQAFEGKAAPIPVEYVGCNSAFTTTVATNKAMSELAERTGKFVSPGDTLAVTHSTTTTRTNSVSIGLKIKEIFNISVTLQSTISHSESYSWSLTNNYTSDKEAGLYFMYDQYVYKNYVYNGDGTCTVPRQNSILKVYTGTKLALIP